MALGEMASELLLASCRAVPAKLERSGFRFTYESLAVALGELMGGKR